MYARYIPPSKGSNGAQKPAQSPTVSPPPPLKVPPPTSTPVKVATIDAGGSSYGRFIPNKKTAVETPSKPASENEESSEDSSDEESTSSEDSSDEEDSSSLPKRKTDELTDAASINTESKRARVATEAEVSNGINGMTLKDGKRERKEKRKKTTEPESESDDGKNERHRALLQRKEKSLKLASEIKRDEEEEEVEEEAFDLEPLPQPEQPDTGDSRPTYDTLPPWLAAPIQVNQGTRKPFAELGLLPKAARVLEEQGYPDAFAVQTAAIPLLLPSSRQRPGDVLISAATGSGKTLAYTLPIVRDISQESITRLRALVVLPTRELVKQVQETFELCARAYEGHDRKRVRIGISVGSQTLKAEQDAFVESESHYDTEAFNNLNDERHETMELVDTLLTDGKIGRWENEVVHFMSKIDVLICTPGRLVEHLEQTSGFSIDYVRWLVVDEADKLLAQSFQRWLELVMENFKHNKGSNRDFPDLNLSGPRKVILSATLTRDLSLLNQLSLRRPQLIILENSQDTHIAEHTLPSTLKEFAIRIHDVNLKPLYLMDLLRGSHMTKQVPQVGVTSTADEDSSETDTSSDSSSDDSDSSSDTDTSTSGSDMSLDEKAVSKKKPTTTLKTPKTNTCLIFTKSNESALRLSRLISLLHPQYSEQLSTLTSTTPSHIRRKTLRAFISPSSPIRLVVASDLVARGIDIPKLDHVINYDLPPSAASYVHRIGRTARAGRSGCAWTLVGDSESGWFWGKIGKSSGMRRAQKVERVMIEERNEEEVHNYEQALRKLGEEASNTRSR